MDSRQPSGAGADHPWLPAASGRGELCCARRRVWGFEGLAA